MPRFNKTRRHILLGGLASAASWLTTSTRPAMSASKTSSSTTPFGPRWKIEGATVLSMDPEIGDFERGDVLVDNGVIVKVASHIDAPDTPTINGGHHIVFPGFVDAHNHMWQTQMRGLFGQSKNTLFFAQTQRYAPIFRPEDIEVSEYVSALENAAAGITTSNDFFDNNRDPSYAEAALRGLRAAPIRTRLLYGNRSKTDSQMIDLDHLSDLLNERPVRGDHGHVEIGLAWRLPRDVSDTDAMAIKHREYVFATNHQLPMSVHISGQNHSAMFDKLISAGYLTKGLQLVHATDAQPRQLEALSRSGASLVITPVTEQRVAYGLTRFDRFRDTPRLGLGIDGNGLAGSANMFEVMRLLALTQIGATEDQTSIDTQRLFRTATLGGAESMGIADRVGSITPGKAADLAMVDTRALNLGMAGREPYAELIFSARPENITFVCVGGRIVKRHGALIGIDQDAALDRMRASLEYLHQQADRTAPSG